VIVYLAELSMIDWRNGAVYDREEARGSAYVRIFGIRSGFLCMRCRLLYGIQSELGFGTYIYIYYWKSFSPKLINHVIKNENG